jgi:hypothetical protein
MVGRHTCSPGVESLPFVLIPRNRGTLEAFHTEEFALPERLWTRLFCRQLLGCCPGDSSLKLERGAFTHAGTSPSMWFAKYHPKPVTISGFERSPVSNTQIVTAPFYGSPSGFALFQVRFRISQYA